MSNRLCTYQGCGRIAQFIQNPKSGYLVGQCETHKSQEAVPIEDLESIDAEQPLPMVIKVKDFKECKHLDQILVDDELRIVECGECGKALDPITCLMDLARDLRTIEYRLNAQANAARKNREAIARKVNRRISPEARESIIKMETGK